MPVDLKFLRGGWARHQGSCHRLPWPARTPLLATWFAGGVVLRAVIRGGRADERLGLVPVQPMRSRDLTYLVPLGVAGVEILAHRVRGLHVEGRRTQVDAVRLHEVVKVLVRLVG